MVQRTIVFSIFLVGFFYYAGIGHQYTESGRLILLKSNANSLGAWAAIVIILAIDLIIVNKAKGFYLIYLIGAILLAFKIMMVTGSRTALLMLGIGFIIYYIFLNRSIGYKLVRLIPVVVIVVIAYSNIMSNELITSRIDTEMERRDFGGRLPIWEATIDIIKENPIMGAGVGKFSAEITRKRGRLRATHNEFLTILAYGGILGLLVFLFFLSAIGRRSLLILRFKGGSYSSLPLALFIMFTAFLGAAGGSLTTFFTWFILALIVVKSEKLTQNSQDTEAEDSLDSLSYQQDFHHENND